MEWYWPEKIDLPGYKPTVKGHPKQIKDAARLIHERDQPVIYAGGGILKANATNELRELAELTDIPVVTTLMARGVMPDEHPLCLGMPGMHGNYTAVTSMQKADLLITLGARFDDRVTGDPELLRAERQGHPRRHRPGRARQGAPARRADRRRRQERDRRADQGGEGRAAPSTARPTRRAWLAQLHEWQDELPAQVPAGRGRAAEAAVRRRARCATTRPTTASSWRVSVSTRCGRASCGSSSQPHTWVNSGGLGTMGYAVPAAVGAKVGRPDRMVWAIDGDGCFQMTAQELVTASVGAHPGEDRDPQQRVPRAWCGSGRSSSTRSATARCTCRPTCPTT